MSNLHSNEKTMKRLYKIFSGILTFFVLASCSKGFEDINKNPNEFSDINPEYLLGTSVYQTLNSSCGAIKKIALDNYVQYNYGQTNQFGRYGDVPSTNSSYFKNFYNYALLPIHFVIEEYEGNEAYANRWNMTKIWEAYIFSQITSIWGPIPMSAALSGQTSIPYDSEPEIYQNLLSTLKTCAEAINLEGDVFQNDPVYGGEDGRSDLKKWIRFANSLRLRLAVRICNADRALAMEHISELMADEDLMMTSNEDNCTVRWGDNEGTRNYYYDYFIVQTANSDKANAAGEGFLMHTAPYKDPRLPKFFKECTDPKMPENFHWAPWWGIPKTSHTPVSGMLDASNPHSGTLPQSYSMMLDNYFAMDYAQVILSFAEVSLLKAEIGHLGLGSGSKANAAYYSDGIRASMEQFGVTDNAAIETYLTTDGIEWGTTSDLETAPGGEEYYMDYLKLSSGAIKDTDEDAIYHQIIMQQYIAMFNQAIDAWTLIRRSQVLDLPPHYQPETGYKAVNAGSPDVQFAYIPQRFVYPSSEIQDNSNEVEKAISQYLENGADQIDTKLWFAKSQLINQRLKQLVENYNK